MGRGLQGKMRKDWKPISGLSMLVSCCTGRDWEGNVEDLLMCYVDEVLKGETVYCLLCI